ncbi:MAG TPA: nucleoside deaminase [Mollicutes bacterium]|nr:nucleoside deaminase [Mollicutes bacterium]
MEEIYMSEAIEQAKKALRKGEVPVGAVIVKDSKIIARAHNKRETKKDTTCHAEILAIKKACKKIKDWRLNGCTIYVTLEPCPMCMGAIKQARMDKVVYGTKNTKEVDLPLVITNSDVQEKECSRLLKLFFKKMRN